MRTWRAAFWCAVAERDVEVEFELRGDPGFHDPSVVTSCSTFEPPTAIACSRRCLDVSFRRRWAPSLPVDTRGIV